MAEDLIDTAEPHRGAALEPSALPASPPGYELGRGKGVRNLLCEAPLGPSRQKVPSMKSLKSSSVARFFFYGVIDLA
jgi:hypothetical protein